MVNETIKTGTTCIGLLFKDGVILAADRRATGGAMPTENLQKVFNVSKKIVATIAGHAAPSQLTIRVIKSELKLLELKNERDVRVKEAAMILNSMQYSGVRSGGSIVSLILGGYDEIDNFSLYNLSPDGTILPHDGFVVDGSGSIFIKGIFDNDYNENMSEADALKLIEKSFLTSFKNDTASGGGFIAKIITKKDVREVSKKLLQAKLV